MFCLRNRSTEGIKGLSKDYPGKLPESDGGSCADMPSIRPEILVAHFKAPALRFLHCMYISEEHRKVVCGRTAFAV